ncbi:unnamed protein product [Durusdinium trenchii]|uniref:Peptide-N(4)-(N-acetyl-beta-glucosaminyl)asparagine amidase n=2 Tax=Durusdinium trenchii TaxID=1381693 RepID=A0ABP0JW10_9DINO
MGWKPLRAESARTWPVALGVALWFQGLTWVAMDSRSAAEQVLRKKVWSVRKKWELLGSYSHEKTEEVLASFELPKPLAERCGLPFEGATWLDAVKALCSSPCGPVELWQRVEAHPIVEYVHVQCQNCGHQVPDTFPADEDPNLSEEEPTDSEKPLVRAGWFRGPKGPVVFVYRCPSCGCTSRWFRSVHPEITLNPRRWGRLCGEQEDLKAWLAKYLSIPLRVCVPLDWDHVWTEVFNGDRWVPLDQNCLHFARRLHEGIGAWTHVLAIGTPGSGDVLEATEEVTEAYLRHAEGSAEEAR